MPKEQLKFSKSQLKMKLLKKAKIAYWIPVFLKKHKIKGSFQEETTYPRSIDQRKSKG
ncbi:MAG: hypothetical protein WD048_10035 [Chitinophagales bacterium]